MDLVTLFGLFLGVVGIVGGMLLEGGHLDSLIQLTAAIIVFGGTFGAVLVSTTRTDLRTALSLFPLGFRDPDENESRKVLEELVRAAQIARMDSILALEKQIKNFSHPFMQSVFKFVIDGVEPHVLRELFEDQIDKEEENLLAGAKVFSDAGGFAPTIGIIGAVLGLIHVMSNLTDTSKLGAGIAVAFVATVYGVGSANLLFLPLGNKLKRKIRKKMETKQMILEGALGIMSGWNPFVIEEKLKSYLENPRSDSSRAA